MKIAVLIVRVLLGAGFTTFGLNILFPFLPQPPLPPESAAMHFMMAAGPTHWMHLVGVVQVIGGLLVLSGGAAPLGLTLLAPVLVNILAFHALLKNGEGLAPGIVFSIFEGFLIYAYRAHFAGLLTTKARHSV